MRAHHLLLTVTAVSLALTTGCSAGAEAPPAAASPSASSSSTSPSSPSDQASPSGSSSPTSASAATPVLMATVGTKSDPGAFEIALTDADGQSVTTVPAGDYTVQVEDYAKIHDFHLTGDGVDETTTVSGTGATTWQVSLTKGTYDYVCDPHAGTMKGTLTVT